MKIEDFNNKMENYKIQLEKGENIDKEINYFKKALERYKTKYHDTPIRVKEWRKKDITQ